MKYLLTKELVSIPQEVQVSAKKRVVEVVDGPRGKITKSFKYCPIDIFAQTIENHKKKSKKTKIIVQQWQTLKKQRCQVRSVTSQINNMIIGVTQGFKYQMVCVYPHFPIRLWVLDEGQTIEFFNFLGEQRKRVIKALPGVTFIQKDCLKDIITIIGNDINNVSLTSALIHQSFKVGNRKDIRKFLDGVYVSEKGLDNSFPQCQFNFLYQLLSLDPSSKVI